MVRLCRAIVAVISISIPAMADVVQFDFDSLAPYGSVPVDTTIGGLTATLSATGSGFSIQTVGTGTAGLAPVGFSGNCIYPNSIYAADLRISFSQPLTDFSILYADEEYGCDTAARMRVTAYLNGTYVGTNTAMANAGTWPSATLAFNSAAPFDSVVVHYDAPPTGENWGPVFMADNMVVGTAASVPEPSAAIAIGLVAGNLALRRRPRA